MSDSLRDDQPARHPVVVAWDNWRMNHPRILDGTADGQYLRNRLQEAFQAGWQAAEDAVEAALNGRNR